MPMSATSLTVTTILSGTPKGVGGGWIAIQIPKGAVILLTSAEVTQGLKRGKYWTRHQQLAARLQAAEAGR